MLHNFEPGDFLIFQLESGYALLRVLAVDPDKGDAVWHLTAYGDLFLDPESAEKALESPANLIIDRPHVALTNRAFESTQLAKLINIPLTADELARLDDGRRETRQEVSDRSIRLVLGLR